MKTDQKPVAWMAFNGLVNPFKVVPYTQPLYTAPQSREWQSLTDEDWDKIINRHTSKKGCEWDEETYSLIESMLKEKNT